LVCTNRPVYEQFEPLDNHIHWLAGEEPLPNRIGFAAEQRGGISKRLSLGLSALENGTIIIARTASSLFMYRTHLS
jgi:hypothetical protein